MAVCDDRSNPVVRVRAPRWPRPWRPGDAGGTHHRQPASRIARIGRGRLRRPIQARLEPDRAFVPALVQVPAERAERTLLAGRVVAQATTQRDEPLHACCHDAGRRVARSPGSVTLTCSSASSGTRSRYARAASFTWLANAEGGYSTYPRPPRGAQSSVRTKFARVSATIRAQSSVRTKFTRGSVIVGAGSSVRPYGRN